MKIVRITTERFFDPTKGGYCNPKGQYCFKDERGFVGFIDNPFIPYFPAGGKNVLISILKDGGFVSEKDLVFIQPMPEPTLYAHGA